MLSVGCFLKTKFLHINMEDPDATDKPSINLEKFHFVIFKSKSGDRQGGHIFE